MEDARVAVETIDLCLRAATADGEAADMITDSNWRASRHVAMQHAFRLTQRRRMKRARRIQFESHLLAQATVVLASSSVLRALRNARTEDEAAAGLCALLGAVEPGSCRRAVQVEPEPES